MRDHKTFTRHFLFFGAKIILKRSFFDFTQPAHNEFCSFDTTTGICNRLRKLSYLPSTLSSFTGLYTLYEENSCGHHRGQRIGLC